MTRAADIIDVSHFTVQQLDLITQAFSRGCWNEDRIDFNLEHTFLRAIYTTIAAKVASESALAS